ncbi:MAG: right-handed parallel beta-helix repeat-containing protein [Ruminococcus sp.]|nr:right-handed parallel beta-helix repeat-containing protein [Ruminococcus sp.]
MIRTLRPFIACAAVMFFAAVFLSIKGFAYDYSTITGTNATGASISFDDPIEISVLDFDADPSGKEDSAEAFQDAFCYAHRHGTDKQLVKIIVPEGTYNLKKTLYIFSNTWVCADKNAVMVRNHAAGSIVRNYQEDDKGGYAADKRIVIEGGVWDGRPTASSYEFSNMRFGHMSDLIIKNAVIKNNYNGHHIELGGVQRVTIEGCEVCGFTGKSRKEAIQLDTMINESVFNSYAPFDDTACDNVVIKNCSFHDLDRAVGSHSGMLGVYYTNIVISGCTFTDLTGSAIPMINYKNCLIENNTMTNVGTAIDIKHMALESMEYYYSRPAYTTEKINDVANIVVRNNTITNAVTKGVPTPYAIRIYGKHVTDSSFLPDYDFMVKGIKITGNTINAAGSAIAMVNTEGIFIDSNTLSYNTDEDNLSDVDAIVSYGGSSVSVTRNKISSPARNGVMMDGGRDNTISENDIGGAADNAISLTSTQDADVEQNTISSPVNHGIRLANGCKGAKLLHNTIDGAGGHAILSKGCSVEAGANTLTSSGSNGLAAEEGSVIKCYGSEASSNTNYGLKASGSSTIYVSTDTFSNNGKGGMIADETSQILLSSAKDLGTEKVTSTTVELSWEEISMADRYLVYRRLNSGDNDFELLCETSDLGYIDDTATPATRYTYRVTGILKTESGEYEGKAADVSLRTHLTIALCQSDIPSQVAYTGSARTPMFNVFLDNCELVKDVDYYVVFTNNVSIGKAKATVFGKGQYCDSKDFEFDIVLGKAGTVEYNPAMSSQLSSVFTPDGTTMRPQSMSVCTVKVTSLKAPAKKIRFASFLEPEDYINELKADAPVITVRTSRTVGGEQVFGAVL